MRKSFRKCMEKGVPIHYIVYGCIWSLTYWLMGCNLSLKSPGICCEPVVNLHHKLFNSHGIETSLFNKVEQIELQYDQAHSSIKYKQLTEYHFPMGGREPSNPFEDPLGNLIMDQVKPNAFTQTTLVDFHSFDTTLIPIVFNIFLCIKK